MGSMMALEAVKLIARAGTPLRGALLIYDGLHADTRRVRTAARRLPGLRRGGRVRRGPVECLFLLWPSGGVAQRRPVPCLPTHWRN